MATTPQASAAERNPPPQTPPTPESIVVHVGSVSEGTAGREDPHRAPAAEPPIEHPIEHPIEPPTDRYSLDMFLTSHPSAGPVNGRLLETPSAYTSSTAGNDTVDASERRAEQTMREFDAIFKK